MSGRFPFGKIDVVEPQPEGGAGAKLSLKWLDVIQRRNRSKMIKIQNPEEKVQLWFNYGLSVKLWFNHEMQKKWMAGGTSFFTLPAWRYNKFCVGYNKDKAGLIAKHGVLTVISWQKTRI